MKTIIYIRGFNHNNSEHSSKFLQLKEYFNSKEYDIFEISTNFLDVEDIKKSIKEISEIYKRNFNNYNDFLIIGNSLGGLIATYMRTRTNAKTILINPAIFYNKTNGVKLPKDVYCFFDVLYSKILDDLEKEYEMVFLSKNDDIINPSLFIDSRFKTYTKNIIMVESDHRFENFKNYFKDLNI